MRTGERTFCRLEVKWLCQNSVMRSVSGESVVSISSSHQPFSSRPRATSSRWYCWRSSALIRRTRPRGSQAFAHAGGAVRGACRTASSSRSTASRRESRAYSSILSRGASKPVRPRKWRASSAPMPAACAAPAAMPATRRRRTLAPIEVTARVLHVAAQLLALLGAEAPGLRRRAARASAGAPPRGSSGRCAPARAAAGALPNPCAARAAASASARPPAPGENAGPLPGTGKKPIAGQPAVSWIDECYVGTPRTVGHCTYYL